MIWIAPSEKDTDNAALEKRLWEAADQFRANSGLKSQEYSAPVLGLIFLRFAEVRFANQRAKLEKAGTSSRRGNRVDDPTAYHAEGILYLVPNARFDFLLGLPEAANIGAKVNEAMRDIEKHNSQLAGVLPKTYNLFSSTHQAVLSHKDLAASRVKAVVASMSTMLMTQEVHKASSLRHFLDEQFKKESCQ